MNAEELLRKLIRIDSQSHKSNKEIVDFISFLFPKEIYKVSTFKKGDLELCNKTSLTGCRDAVLRSSKGITACDEMTNITKKDKCYFILAFRDGNVAICSKLSREVSKDRNDRHTRQNCINEASGQKSIKESKMREEKINNFENMGKILLALLTLSIIIFILKKEQQNENTA